MTETSTDVGTEWLVERIARATGLSFAGCHHDRMVESVARMKREARAGDAELAVLLDHDPATLASLVDRLTVGETYFFREEAHLDLVRDAIVPRLSPVVTEARPLRVWSAGCASGEEPYSIAVLLDELGLLSRSRIVATDLSARAVERARAAEYSRWSLRRCDDRQQRAYFRSSGDRFRLHERFVDAVEIRQLNLLDGPPPPAAFDVVLCRNVLIYLTDEALEIAARTLHDALAPEGWLLLGASDPPLEHDDLVRSVTDAGVAYRRRSAVAPFPARVRDVSAPPVALATADDQMQRAEVPRTVRRRPHPNVPEPSADTASIGTDLLDAERHYLSAVQHALDGRAVDAARAATAALFLEPGLVVAHLVLAQAQHQAGHANRARRSLRNALELLLCMPPDDEVPLADGERADMLAAAVARRLETDR